MDKPLESNYMIPTIHDIASLAEQRYRQPLLRRVSQSDPHLDDQKNSNLDRTKNALMPLDQTKSTSAVPTAVNSQIQPPDIGRNFSALNLGLLNTGEENSSIGPLRKAASFIHGTSFGIGRKPSSSSLYQLQPNFCIGGGFTPVTSSVTTVAENTHSHHGGLSMSVQPANNQVTSLKNNEMMQHSSSMSGGLFSSAGSDSSSRGLVANASSDSLSSPAHKPGGMGIFSRGFFAKPMRTEEENYRYIMALDRS